jgi:hypothetical protein
MTTRAPDDDHARDNARALTEAGYMPHVEYVRLCEVSTHGHLGIAHALAKAGRMLEDDYHRLFGGGEYGRSRASFGS